MKRITTRSQELSDRNNNSPRVIRFQITFIEPDGCLRRILGPNWGHLHHETREQAEAALRAVLQNNTPAMLASVYGPFFLSSCRVDEIECYPSGDAVGIYVTAPIGTWRCMYQRTRPTVEHRASSTDTSCSCSCGGWFIEGT